MLIEFFPTQTLHQHLASPRTNFYCQHALTSIPKSTKLSVQPCRATEVLSQAGEAQSVEQQSDRACGRAPWVIWILKGCAITEFKPGTVTLGGLRCVCDRGVIVHPPGHHQCGEEINWVVTKGRDVDWASILSDDPRICSNEWYTAGRSTPLAGESIYRQRVLDG